MTEIIYISLHQNDCCITMGSDERYFHVSVGSVHKPQCPQDSVHKPQTHFVFTRRTSYMLLRSLTAHMLHVIVNSPFIACIFNIIEVIVQELCES